MINFSIFSDVNFLVLFQVEDESDAIQHEEFEKL